MGRQITKIPAKPTALQDKDRQASQEKYDFLVRMGYIPDVSAQIKLVDDSKSLSEELFGKGF